MKADERRVAKGLYWDRALNLVMGCMPFSESCTNCWAAREAHMHANHPNPRIRELYEGLTEDGRFNGTIRYNWDAFAGLAKAKKPRIWSVWNDLFHVKVSESFINSCFEIFESRPEQTIIVLTKRIKRARKLCELGELHKIPDNVILGTTVELPQYEDRIEALLQIPAKTRMVSLEPLLGRMDLNQWLWQECTVCWGPGEDEWGYDIEPREDGLGWVVIGGENAALDRARPIGYTDITIVAQQCQEAGVPVFVKQMGTRLAHEAGYRDFKGRDMSEWPQWLRVREFPEI